MYKLIEILDLQSYRWGLAWLLVMRTILKAI